MIIVEPKSLRGWFHKYQQTPPCDIFELCEKIGINCTQEVMDVNKVGIINRLGEYKYEIFYNQLHSKTRQRFTVAHMLGHLFLHREYIEEGVWEDMMFSPKGALTQKQEREASAFAADMLMPKEFLDKYIEEGKSFSDVVRLFDISDKALRFRLNKFDYELK